LIIMDHAAWAWAMCASFLFQSKLLIILCIWQIDGLRKPRFISDNKPFPRLRSRQRYFSHVKT
jgi:hypothetical protein